jgi:hypothetical protein
LAAQVWNDLVSQPSGFLTQAGTTLVAIGPPLERTRSEQGPSSAEETRLGRGNRGRLRDDFRPPVTAGLVQGRRRIKRRKQGRVYGTTRVVHSALATDQPHGTTAKIVATSKARWAVENFFTESHQSFSAGKLPSRKFPGHQFFWAVLSVVYNLMPFFKRDCPPRVYRAVSFAPVRRPFLEHAVMIEERSAVEIHLIFTEDYPRQREANIMLRKTLAA